MYSPLILRLYRDYIQQVGVVRFEYPERTVYAASHPSLLQRQYRAMGLLRHLELAPAPVPVRKVRGVFSLNTTHRPLVSLTSVWQRENRQGKVELIRRVGAAVGMLHSLRSSGVGSIVGSNQRPAVSSVVADVRKSLLRLTVRGQGHQVLWSAAELIARCRELWGEDCGGTLAGNWHGLPPMKIWDSGLMFMNLSQASYSVPMRDLVSFRPQGLGIEKDSFFWEHFFQGYGATYKLPDLALEKLEMLHRIRFIQALAAGVGEKEAHAAWKNKWWEQIL